MPADADVVVDRRPEDRLPAAGDRRAEDVSDKGGKLLVLLDPPDKADAPPLTNLIALLKDWAIDVGNNVVVDVAAWASCIGTRPDVPVAAPPYPSHPITEHFRLLTAFPLARSVKPVEGAVNGHTAQTFVQSGPQQLGGNRPQDA